MTRLQASTFAFAMAVLLVLIGIGLAFTPNSEGWAAGPMFAALYALPVLAVGTAIRAQARWLRRGAGIAALLLALFYAAVPIGNWTGYSTTFDAARAVIVSVPAVLGCLAAFWGGALAPEPAGDQRPADVAMR